MEECCKPCFEIFTGEAKTLNLRAAYKATGLPFDLTSCTEIKVALPNADGTFTTLLYSLAQVQIVSPAVYGQIAVPISAAVSALLNVGTRQNVDVGFTITGQPAPIVVRFFEALTVLQSPV